MSRTAFTLGLLLPLAMVACEDKADSEAEGAPSASVPMTDEQIDQASIPVKEDFEEEARKSIDENNVESQVDALEKAIEADGP